jgi:alpha-glucosidase (family GH31 glycosyl hydrolase)
MYKDADNRAEGRLSFRRTGRRSHWLCAACVIAGTAGAPAGATAAARTVTVDAGALRAVIQPDPWAVRFVDRSGSVVLSAEPGGRPDSAAGAIGFSTGGVWFHATRAVDGHIVRRSYAARLVTDDPGGRSVAIRIAAVHPGVVSVSADGPAGAEQMGVGFDRGRGERFLGFGERSDAVVRDRGTVEDYVAEGPYQPAEDPLVSALVPPVGFDPRPDATYFPVPWLLSSRGYGFLLEGIERSAFTLGSPWSVASDGNRLAYRVYAGPRPAQALGRFTRDTGRQPTPAAPFFLGPWWQPSGDAAANIRRLQQAGGGALGSLAQTYTHYLPCGAQQGQAATERGTTRMYHEAGLAVTTYFNPMICTGYQPPFERAAAAGLLARNPLGQPYLYRYTGVGQFQVGQFDFTAPGASAFYGRLLSEAVGNGYDGWMEDFGEYTPTDAVSADHTPGTEMHNLYPVLYHGAAYAYSRHSRRPLARFNRSGWTGAARVSQAVWGGDPSTWFGFDGLKSAIANGLTIGASGVSLWGSDIGGYFALSLPQTTPDLERRWIEFGFASGVMRTEANGFSLGSTRRAQIFDPDVLPVWVRYARLRTQLEPYLAAAERQYNATGMPLMRQLMLVYPGDPRAATRDDEYLLGPDLLVAPVIQAGARTRSLYLPPGRWIDFWRSVSIEPGGAPHLRRPVVLAGGRQVTVPAPDDQLPMFVRAGATLGLLPADVQTLSAYGSGVVHLRDRDGRRTLLAWPLPGAPGSIASLADNATAHSRTVAGGGWLLRINQTRTRTIGLQAALSRRPCRLLVNGRSASFHYTAGVLTATVRLASGIVRAIPCCHPSAPPPGKE